MSPTFRNFLYIKNCGLKLLNFPSFLGIPLMLSVLADVGGLMAGGLEGAWFVVFVFLYIPQI